MKMQRKHWVIVFAGLVALGLAGYGTHAGQPRGFTPWQFARLWVKNFATAYAAAAEEPLRRASLAAAQRGAAEQPRAKDQAEKRILEVLDDMDRNQRRGMMNVPVWDGRMVRLLTEALGAKHVVEIGTSNGYSGIWFCLALRKTGGKLTTYEIDPGRAALARKNFARAGVDPLITLVEGDAHQEITRLQGPLDVVFIDADKQGYPDYLEKLLPLVRPGGLILAHNMDMGGSGIAEYIEAVTTDPNLETLLLERSSLGITLKKR